MCVSLLIIIAKIKAQAEGNGSALGKACNTDIGYL
jgi:hypothetical protein